MSFFQESSLEDLYQSAVKAFPRTTMRQYAISPIVFKEVRWTPFVGMGTLFVKGWAENTHHNTVYEPMILFKGVKYNSDKPSVNIIASNGGKYRLEKLSLENTDVLLRCGCKDFYWRFAHYNHLDKSLYGRNRAPYISQGVGPPANPLEMEGLCKHLMKLSKVLQEAGIFVEIHRA
jgi:hypothetical protein